MIAVNNEGKGVILGSSLLEREDIPSFSWAFEILKRYGGNPKMIMTDGSFKKYEKEKREKKFLNKQNFFKT